MQHRSRADDHRAAAGEIAEQHAKQQGEPRSFQHRLGAVVVVHVSDLMAEHARNLVDRNRLGQQPVEDIDTPAWQRDGVDVGTTHHKRVQRQGQFGRPLQGSDELREGRTGGGGPGGVAGAALERLSPGRGGEHLPHLHVDGGAKAHLNGDRQMRRNAIGKHRHPPNRAADQRGDRSKADAHNLEAGRPIGETGSVGRVGARQQRRRQRLIMDFQPRRGFGVGEADSQDA